jgi:hypothetical protein
VARRLRRRRRTRADHRERHAELGHVAEIAGGAGKVERFADPLTGARKIALVPGRCAEIVQSHREATRVTQLSVERLGFLEPRGALGELPTRARDPRRVR